MPKPMTPPFGTYEPKVCSNPECKEGPNSTRATFTPKTPWQSCCSDYCRNHKATMKRRTGKKSDQSDDPMPFIP